MAVTEINVLTVDDHALIREGIARALISAEDITVVGEAATGHDALDQVRNLSPAVVILDNKLPDTDGARIIQTLRRQPCAPSILMLSFQNDGWLVRQTLEAGARGFLVKSDADAESLREAIRSVAAGRTWVSRSAANALASCVAGRSGTARLALTPRERQIWRLLAEGLSNRDIALSLAISERTAKFHVSNVLHKLAAESRGEAAALAYSSHFISIE